VFARIADVAGRLAGFLAEHVVPSILTVAGALARNLAPLLEKIAPLWDALMPILERLWGFVDAVVVPILVDLLIPALAKLLGFVADVATALLTALGPALDGLSDAFDSVVGFIKPVLDWLRRLLDVVGDVADALGNLKVPDLKLPDIRFPSFGSAPGTTSAGVGAFAGAPVVNISTGVGDPVAIGRAVAKVLDAWQLRGGR
jgi:hypothetical protein